MRGLLVGNRNKIWASSGELPAITGVPAYGCRMNCCEGGQSHHHVMRGGVMVSLVEGQYSTWSVRTRSNRLMGLAVNDLRRGGPIAGGADEVTLPQPRPRPRRREEKCPSIWRGVRGWKSKLYNLWFVSVHRRMVLLMESSAGDG